jgi:hypothetical protein
VHAAPTTALDNQAARHRKLSVTRIRKDGGVSLQVEGVADILARAEREAYGREYLAQFPGSRVLLEEFAAVRVRPCWLRHYDARTDPVARVRLHSGW